MSVNRFESTPGRVVRHVLAALIVVSALFPLAWMAIAGFKSRTEVLRSPFQFFPEVWLVQNYVDILSDPDFMRAMGITFGGALIFAVGTLAVNSMAAYVFARLEFPGKRVMWILTIMTMFVPSMAILITSYLVVSRLGMLDTLAVLLLPALASAYAVFFIRQFYLNVPLALEEAAVIDGASRWQIYRHIFLPLSKPPFVIVGIGAYLAYWNAFVWPVMTITDPNLFQIMQYLADFRGQRSSEMGLLMAGSTLAALPTIVLFLIFQRWIIGNIKIAGLK